MAKNDGDVRVVPTWRPDAAMAVEDPPAFNGWLEKLEAAAGTSVGNLTQLFEALDRRHAAFHDVGCRMSDHGLEEMYAEEWSDAEIASPPLTRASIPRT